MQKHNTSNGNWILGSSRNHYREINHIESLNHVPETGYNMLARQYSHLSLANSRKGSSECRGFRKANAKHKSA